MTLGTFSARGNKFKLKDIIRGDDTMDYKEEIKDLIDRAEHYIDKNKRNRI